MNIMTILVALDLETCLPARTAGCGYTLALAFPNFAGGGNSQNAFGGRGGFVQAVIPTTPGENLTIIVGSGGLGINSGNALNTLLSGGGGGGTAVLRGSTPLLVAGGGGGAGSDPTGSWLLVRLLSPPSPPQFDLASRLVLELCVVCISGDIYSA